MPLYFDIDGYGEIFTDEWVGGNEIPIFERWSCHLHLHGGELKVVFGMV